MKITNYQNKALNDYQNARGYVPEKGEDGFIWINSKNIEITDSDLFITTVQSSIDICQDAILDEIEISKHKKWLKSMLKLHEEMVQ